MIVSIFTWLNNLLYTNSALALTAALGWGVLSVVLSPCHLATIPLIVGYLGNKRLSQKSAITLASLFAFGILVSIAIIGLLTTAIGRMAGDIGAWGNYLLAGIFIVFGLALADVFSFNWTLPRSVSGKAKGGAFIMGLIIGLALGPCTFAFMAPVLGLSLGIANTKPVFAVALLLFYGLGHAGVVAVAGSSVNLVERLLKFNQSAGNRLKRICGILVALGGIYVLISNL